MDAAELIKEGLNRRFRDPFLSAFSITFLLWNFEIFLYLFSELTVDEKIKQIHNLFSYSAFLWPILITILITLVFPYVFRRLYSWHETLRVQHANIRTKAESELYTHQVEIEGYKKQVSKEIEKNEELQVLISEKDQTIGSLNTELRNVEKNLGELKEKYENQEPEQRIVSARPSKIIQQTSAFISALEKLKLDPDLHMQPRDFAEKKNVSPQDTIKQYITSAQQIVSQITKNNSQSQIVETQIYNFNTAIKAENYTNANLAITEMLKASLKRDEIEHLAMAIELIRRIKVYTR